MSRHGLTLILTLFVASSACSRAGDKKPAPPAPRYKMSGPLVSSQTTMVTAWELPKNPLTDSTLDDSKLSKEIQWGFRIFTNTPGEAPQFAPGKVSCSNCHLNAGQRERSLPLVGVAGMFPEYNKRSGRLYSLGDRIVDCFVRSENAAERIRPGENLLPATTSKEVLAVSAYITWLARGSEVGKNPAMAGTEHDRIGQSDSDSEARPGKRRSAFQGTLHELSWR